MSERKTTVVTCDRCKHSQEFGSPASSDRYNFWGKAALTPNLGGAGCYEYDLCQLCVQAFWLWIEPKKED